MKRWVLLVVFPLCVLSLSDCGGGSHGGVLPGSTRVTKALGDAYSNAVLADHPTAYYRLDDTASSAVDSSGNALNGTIGANVTKNIPGLLSSSTDAGMSFPGTASAPGTIGVPQTALLQPASAVTLEAWLRFSTAPAAFAIVAAYGSDASYSPYDLYFDGSGHIVAQFFTTNGVVIASSASPLSANTTYYVAGTYDGSTARVYVNGVQVGSASKTGTLTNYLSGFGFTIGADPAFSDPAFKGTIDEVAVYAGNALAASSIQNHYNAGTQGGPPPTATPSPAPTGAGFANTVLGDNPSQYYKLDESAGPNAVDSSTTQANGTYVGAVTFGAAGPLLNQSSNAISLPGGSASVGVSLPNPNAAIGTSYTIETWVYPNAASSFMTIWGFNGTHRLLLNPQGQLLSQFGAAFTSKGTLSRGQWHEVVFVYNAPAATQSYYIDGAFDSSAPLANTYGAFVGTYYLGQYDNSVNYKWNGRIAQHAFFKTALTSSQIANLYASAGYGGGTASPTPSPTPSGGPSYTDWPTYGDNLARTNYNPNETTLTRSNVAGLSLAWKRDLGSTVTAQPVLATNVSIGGTPHTVLYIGTEGGVFYALDAVTGATLWSQQLNSISTGCLDLPGGTFGITATATFDRTTNRVYVADAKDKIHALDMSSGAEVSGWPISLTTGFMLNHVYGGLALNPHNGMLYVGTGSLCDGTSWKGRIAAINTSTAAIRATFFPASPYQGAGVWGIGGAAIDSADNVYISTGNDTGAPTEHSAFGDSIVQLSPSLSVISSNYPGIQGSDEDFGATPMIYQAGSCGQQVTVKNKSGLLFTYFTSSINSGPMQSLSMAPLTATGQFIGTTAYSPVDNLVYVGDPRGNSTFTHGLIALRPQSDCTLALAWQQTTGPAGNLDDNNNSATVANGVVYFTDGVGNQVFAFNSSTGQQLWNSGSIISGPVMAAPTVDGRLFVSSFDHNLYAFTP